MTLAGFIGIWGSGALALAAVLHACDRKWLDAAFYGALCVAAAACGVAIEIMPELVAYVETGR